jgi:endoglucanase
LVAGDRPTFERLLQWTENNLSGGSLKNKLPAWHWGRRDDQSWGVLDDNSASDADLWMAYVLAQAAKVWGVRRYAELSDSLSDRILRESTAQVNGLGLVLLPAPKGFGPDVSEGVTRVRLNPSYLPISVLRWWARQPREPRWRDILNSSLKVVERSANQGYAPDWVTVTSAGGDGRLSWADADSSDPRLGSYDAVRVYLWLGMMAPEDASRTRLAQKLGGMAQQLARTGEVPERVDVRTGDVLASANPHLGWALLPYLKVLGRDVEFRDLSERLQRLTPRFPAYYEDALMLFASGHLARIYRFDADGSLELVRNSCSNVSRIHSLRLH